MEVYVPRLERAELDDELEAQVLSQEVVVMRDGAWVFLYNNKVLHPSSFLKKRMKRPQLYIEKESF